MSNVPAPSYEVKTPGFLVLRSQRLMSQQLKRVFATVGLNVQQHVGLQLICEGLANGPSDIAKACGLDTGSITRLVDQFACNAFLTEGTDLDWAKAVLLEGKMLAGRRQTGIHPQDCRTEYPTDLKSSLLPAPFEPHLPRATSA